MILIFDGDIDNWSWMLKRNYGQNIQFDEWNVMVMFDDYFSILYFMNKHIYMQNRNADENNLMFTVHDDFDSRYLLTVFRNASNK